nr:hypothetical protein [Brevundimonas sp.]
MVETFAGREHRAADGVEILHDLVVPEADDVQAAGMKVRGAACVPEGICRVLSAVYLDD